ncbi:MAG: hypothetical protein B6I22_14185 [Desulfobacteraceae bacterium 4572_123]|nr:MAG: hypothetical protein B6I22_14185 [Desulfobacteraceae bacterium 4572_123]
MVAFQGEHGAYGDVAARRLVPDGACIPCLEFIDVFRGLEKGHFDLGVVPVENSLEGAVTQVNDLLTTTDLKAIGEAKVQVRHCLLAVETMDYREIRLVYSHPQALAQCRDFLASHRLDGLITTPPVRPGCWPATIPGQRPQLPAPCVPICIILK